jgi:hypothetical protein
MKLNKLQRISVVGNILWIITSFLYYRGAELKAGQKFVDLEYQVCSENPANTMQYCLDQMTETIKIQLSPNWINLLLQILIPLIAFWVLFFIIRKTYRWIKAGK